MKTPVFQIYKAGVNLMGSMAPWFLGAGLVDEVGIKNDELTVTVNDEMRRLPLPRADDVIFPRAGYAETTVSGLGAYKVQRWATGWQPGGAEVMVMTARAVSYTGEVKAGGIKHYDDTTLGDILGDTAKAASLTLSIDPELADIAIDYALRWEASPIDFAVRLAGEYGGIVKPGGERLAVVQRGSGKSASGGPLPTINVTRFGSSGWHIEGEPRPQQGEIAAPWQDGGSGQRKVEKESTGRKGPVHSLIHARASRAAAKAAAAAKSRELNMMNASGFFIVEFDPSYSAGALVRATGFGEGVDGTWPSERISTEWSKSAPVLSTIDVTAKPEGEGVE
ncbi:hypothetical protein [Ancylobacter amanitiformis]|uniref:Phage protein D n=1 Tax=Ancylobacter amanitiformis TaxID=217069 RepID=A0ABU0LX51_9HYPH|nr:hypothetical protein [Ancylobacter amanitiformis]MDQ0513245.1 phage protein D [Ancylobacter amanitiformis]